MGLFLGGIAAGLIACLVLLFLAGRWNERTVVRDWSMVLSPRGEQALQKARKSAATHLSMADYAYERAGEARTRGSVDEALVLIEVAYRTIERFRPKMTQFLAMMSVVSRMASALAPVPPLNPRRFRSPQLRGLAFFNQFVQQFLVSTAERFRLRVFVLGRGFTAALRLLFQTTNRAKEHGEVAAEWDELLALRDDFHALTAESLESFRVLLTSLGAEWRDDGTIWIVND